jgi:hypothetical protein
MVAVDKTDTKRASRYLPWLRDAIGLVAPGQFLPQISSGPKLEIKTEIEIEHEQMR